MTSNKKTTKTKVVDLEKLCNFVVDNFSMWNNFVMENSVSILNFKIRIFKMSSNREITIGIIKMHTDKSTSVGIPL
jgi:hypothetical protein